ncbi:hypothetical protein EWM64_g2652 [Hericium alpestre]|uniref:Rit1 DUSP-like domain-containing protein n=1 Tax=Hericium alpestre TaxID=135208 RepID=A0A4Z0A622_9AGAM|nr:hypothetical protein EWM64_g2652 [Hericium alpestre]
MAFILICPLTDDDPSVDSTEPAADELAAKRVLRMMLPSGKKGQYKFLKGILPKAMDFIGLQLKQRRRICVACESGKNTSVGVALVALQMFFDESGQCLLDSDSSAKAVSPPDLTGFAISIRMDSEALLDVAIAGYASTIEDLAAKVRGLKVRRNMLQSIWRLPDEVLRLIFAACLPDPVVDASDKSTSKWIQITAEIPHQREVVGDVLDSIARTRALGVQGVEWNVFPFINALMHEAPQLECFAVQVDDRRYALEVSQVEQIVAPIAAHVRTIVDNNGPLRELEIRQEDEGRISYRAFRDQVEAETDTVPLSLKFQWTQADDYARDRHFVISVETLRILDVEVLNFSDIALDQDTTSGQSEVLAATNPDFYDVSAGNRIPLPRLRKLVIANDDQMSQTHEVLLANVLLEFVRKRRAAGVSEIEEIHFVNRCGFSEYLTMSLESLVKVSWDGIAGLGGIRSTLHR